MPEGVTPEGVTPEGVQGLSAEEIADLSGVADEYGVDRGTLVEGYVAAEAFAEEVRALFAERRCAWPRTTLIINAFGGVLHYERPELLDVTLTEMPAIPALPLSSDEPAVVTTTAGRLLAERAAMPHE